MFDTYELVKWKKVLELRSKLSQRLNDLDDALKEESLDSDKWMNAYSILHEVTELFGNLEKVVLIVRCRRMDPAGYRGMEKQTS